MNRIRYVLFLAGLTVHFFCHAQQPDSLFRNAGDTLKHHKISPYSPDSLARKQHDPRKATIRSAIIPGWGQIYNRKYWKLPIVYAAIGIPAYTYIYNRKWYHNYQQAISVVDKYSLLGYPAAPDSVLNTLSGD